MKMPPAKIIITLSERNSLNKRHCEECGRRLIRGKTEGLEFWINRRFCCNVCKIANRKELGLIYKNFEYKLRNNVASTCYTITVPKWFFNKYKLNNVYYGFKFTDGKFIVYTRKSKGKGLHKIRNSSGDYKQITIPKKEVEKYNLYNKLFKFNDIGSKYLFYTEI